MSALHVGGREDARPESTIGVLLVGQHPLVRYGMRSALEESGDIKVTGEASSYGEAIRLSGSRDVDVILMHCPAAGCGLLEQLPDIKDAWAPARVVVISACVDSESVATAMRQGADGYLNTESTDEHALVAGVRDAAQGHAALSREAADALVAATRERPRPIDELTPREREVWMLLAEGLDNSEIGRRLYIAERTAKYHAANIMAKLGAHTRAEAVALAHLSGCFAGNGGNGRAAETRTL